MDLDRYIAQNRPGWRRLAELTRTVERRPGRLQPADADEFLRLYRRSSSQLSFVRSHYEDPAIASELNQLVAAANAALYKRTTHPVTGLRRFFTYSFPAAVWKLRRPVAISTALLVIPAIVMALWLSNSDRALDLASDEASRAAYVDEEFEDYYSSAPASEFATQVLINNIRVSFIAFALGVFLCVGTVWILAYNGAALGTSWAVFVVAGQQSKFFGLILPHGLLELSAIVIAGAAGLSMGWAVIAPGDRTRAAAFTEEARRSVVVILGLMVAFVLAGIIEGFITPGLPTVPRVSIGVVVEALFVSYIVAFGRRAHDLGITGLADDFDSGHIARNALTG